MEVQGLSEYWNEFHFYWGHYHYNVNWSSEDQVYIGSVVEFPSLRAHAGTLILAYEEIAKVVSFAISNLRENNEPVPKPEGWIGGDERSGR